MATYSAAHNGIIISSSFVQGNSGSHPFFNGSTSTSYTIPSGRYAKVVASVASVSYGSGSSTFKLYHSGYLIYTFSQATQLQHHIQLELPSGTVTLEGIWGNNGGNATVRLHVIEFANIV